MKKLVLLICVLLVVAMALNAQQTDFPKLTGPYLGQKPPGMVPERFAESVITDDFYPHSKLMISPDGKRIYWSTFIDLANSGFALYCSDFDGKTLSKPTRDTSISKYGVDSFIFSGDGETIYFASQQPLPEEAGKKIYGVWYSQKENSGWSEPRPIQSTLDPAWSSLGSISMNNAGDLYFSGRYQGGSAKIYCSKFVNGNYQKTEPLPDMINAGITLDPFIDPQDRYMLFSATRRDDNIGIIDLYVSFKDNDGNWTPPRNLGETVCTKHMDRFPLVTGDGRFLIFVTAHGNHFPSATTHFHWVSATVIDELKPKE